MACVNAAALPLQMLLRNHPEWRGLPVVVVDRDKPQGIILWTNRHARAQCIRPGMRYASGLGLSTELRGGTVESDEIQDLTETIRRRLWCFSPRVEPCATEPGVFWLDATGLQPVFPSLPEWLSAIEADLRSIEIHASLALGFTRFGTYAAALAGTGRRIFESPAEEKRHTRTLSMDRLPMDPELRMLLDKLGVTTLGAFCDLPPEDIHTRFDAEAHTLHALARGQAWTPLQPSPITEPVEASVVLEYPEQQVDRILLVVEPLLTDVLERLAAQHETLVSLRIRLALEDRHVVDERIAPAEPTLDADRLLPLVRLRLESCRLSDGVAECLVSAEGIGMEERQLSLWSDISQEGLDRARRALEKVRAGLGHDAVVVAHLNEGHLPEAQFSWQPLDDIRAPHNEINVQPPLVRRIFSPKRPLPRCTADDPDGWLLAGITEGPVEEVIGPHHVSGGWWMQDVARSYYYVRTRNKKWYWIYYDRLRRRWFLQGEVQ